MPKRTCELDGCDRKYVARGVCQNHYNMAIKAGMSTGSPGHVIRSGSVEPGATVADCAECGPSAPIAWIFHGTKPICVVAQQLQRENQKQWRENRPPEAKAKQLEYHREYGRKNSRRYRFGLTEADVIDRLEAVGYACELCAKPVNLRTVRFDHDHDCCPTGQQKTCGQCIRGLLCNQCNTGLGLFCDDADSLIRAANYLRRST